MTGRLAALSSESDAVRHRLSWFAALQGVLFLCFVLLDKRENEVLAALLVCSGVALCLPAIAAMYTRTTLRNGLRFLLAMSWVAVGALTLLMREI